MEDSRAFIDIVNGVAPSVTGGLIALMGAIVLFWLQQAAQRRVERSRRIDEAFDRFMEYCSYLSQTLRRAPGTGTFNRWEVYERAWRFTWALEDRDKPVGEWAMRILVGSTLEVTKAHHTSTEYKEKLLWAEENMNLAVDVLNRWKCNKLRTKWFIEQLKKANLDELKVPTIDSFGRAE